MTVIQIIHEILLTNDEPMPTITVPGTSVSGVCSYERGRACGINKD
jgi:hypothetical protein